MSTNYSDTRFKTAPDGQRLRWSPPAPKVHIGMITRVLTRKLMEGMEDMPEARMVIAVIVQAIADCHERDDRDRHDARRFLASRRLDFWCELLGIEADFVRMVAVRSGYLVDEEKLWTPVKRSRRSRQSTSAEVSAHA